MTDREVLKLLRSGQYTVDIDAGTVANRHGVTLKPFTNRIAPHMFVYLFNNGNQRRGIAVHRLVWMSATNQTIPRGFEVHHEDKDPTNNSFDNLFALHPKDHLKVHGNWNVAADDEGFEDDEIPF